MCVIPSSSSDDALSACQLCSLLHPIHSRVLLQYLYLVSLLGSIDIDWSEKMKVLFATSKTASGGAISFADCFDMDYFNSKF